jgi:branched-chain amino acid transport system ATP-binding protein
MTLVELDRATTGYGRSRAVDEVSFALAEGESLCVIGPNGAGKTTLIRALAGGLGLWSGRVVLAGREISALGPDERAVCGVGLCPEGRRILSGLTVRENLLVGATALRKRWGGRRRRRLVGEAFERVYELFPLLAARAAAAAGTLSGGQQQMLAIARALMSRPTLLLLDEPSLGLAPRIIDDVYALLAKLRGEGLTMVVVEEGSSRALGFADHAIVMRGGRAFLQGTASAIREDPRVAAAYLGEGAVAAGSSP